MYGPQITAAVIMTAALVVCLYSHGETMKCNFFAKLFSTIIWVLILYWGGFW